MCQGMVSGLAAFELSVRSLKSLLIRLVAFLSCDFYDLLYNLCQGKVSGLAAF